MAVRRDGIVMERSHLRTSVEQVKKAVPPLGDELAGAEAVGICGSLARGWDFDEHSDIDIFVVVRDKAPGARRTAIGGG